tara:strand:+ start:337 stop:651 length:315 start_codon:yes stop_codon:yes gene_type:complete
MINLDEQKDYYILECNQGTEFGGGRIYEGLQEIKDNCKEWAHCDGYDDPELSSWTIGDCIDNWDFTLWRYNGVTWINVSENWQHYDKVFDFISDNARKLRVKAL